MLYYEKVQERRGDTVTVSTIREATSAEIMEAKIRHSNGECPHTIIVDEPGFEYNFRNCYICGRSLGFV